MFGVSRQAHYQHGWQQDCKSTEEQLIISEVIQIRQHHKSMGTRKLYEKLQEFLWEHQIKIGRDALFDMLASHQLLVRRRRRRISTTMSYHRFHKWPNLIKGFIPQAPNELYVSDITYLKTASGFVYISLITDAYSHKIVGYHVAESLETSASIQALGMALSGLDGGPESHAKLIHHSDRGIQYCSTEYVKILQKHGIDISMTESGDPKDNAIAERVNGILKQEYLCHHKVENLEQAKQALKTAVELYNSDRPHMSIDYKTPNQVHQTKQQTERHWKNYYPKQLAVNQI